MIENCTICSGIDWVATMLGAHMLAALNRTTGSAHSASSFLTKFTRLLTSNRRIRLGSNGFNRWRKRYRPYLPINSVCDNTCPFMARSSSFLLAPAFTSSLMSRACNLKK